MSDEKNEQSPAAAEREQSGDLESIPPHVAEYIENAPPEEVQRLIQLEIRRVGFSGPIPPSSVLESYNEVIPDAAEPPSLAEFTSPRPIMA